MSTRSITVSGWLIFACMLLLSGAASGQYEYFPLPEQIIVLEDLTREPAMLAAMRAQLVALEFGLARPLLARLEGQGSLWNIPDEMTMDEAIAVAAALTAVTGAYDAYEPEELDPCWEGTVPGRVIITFSQESVESARQTLSDLGFVLTVVYPVDFEMWHFLPMEYTVLEAIPIAEEIEGVYRASPMIIGHLDGPPGDTNGDRIVNVLDMISIRNHLNDDVGSGDNGRHDVNNDGFINVLDMIYVRKRLGTGCGM